MAKTKITLQNGNSLTVHYPKDFTSDMILWSFVEEVEIDPEDIEPGTMSKVCRDIIKLFSRNRETSA